jgi:hypothetical protein
MPRVEREWAITLPGAYAKLLELERREYRRIDPRLFFVDDPDERARLAATAPARRSELLDRLEAGLSVTVPRWRFGGHHIPVPTDVLILCDRRIRWFWVAPDDTVTPAARHAPPPPTHRNGQRLRSRAAARSAG